VLGLACWDWRAGTGVLVLAVNNLSVACWTNSFGKSILFPVRKLVDVAVLDAPLPEPGGLRDFPRRQPSGSAAVNCAEQR
jgi:hypothetical protein